MKTRRSLQILSGILALLYCLGMLAVGVLVALSLFGHEIHPIFNSWSNIILENVVPKLTFLPQGDNHTWSAVIVLGVMLGAPALLLLFAAVGLFSKSKNGKEGWRNFGAVLGMLGVLIFVVALELLAMMKGFEVFADKKWLYAGAVLGIGVLLMLFLILSMVRWNKKQAAAEQQPAEAENSEVTESQPADTTAPAEPVNTYDAYDVTVPYSAPRESQTYETPQPAQEQYDYTQYDTRSVRDIMDRTYGSEPVQNVGKDNMKKIQTLQSLYEAKAISKDEYLALVQAYLKDQNSK